MALFAWPPRRDSDFKAETQVSAFLNHRDSTVITADWITLSVPKASILQAGNEVWRHEKRGREEGKQSHESNLGMQKKKVGTGMVERQGR